ncbi:ABC transporter ATP-binding protein [Neobacillus drentensis]|uniref:ABC transporter ATP-binding protein n=1 Tax=Neobacillus drentensis TaxID=220684 RepID=UPI0030002787
MKQILYFTKQIQTFTGRILYFNLIGMVLISLFEGIGVILLIPLINLSGIFNVNSNSSSVLSKVSELFHYLPKTYSLILIFVFYFFLILCQSFFQRQQTILNVKIQQGFIRHLREQTYKLLLQANWSLFLNKRKSDLINLMTTEISRVSLGTNMFLQFLTSLVFTFVQLGIAFWMSPKMTLFVMGFGAVIIFFLRKFVNKSSELGNETYNLTKLFLAGVTDHFNGIKDIKSNMLEQTHISWFISINRRMEQNIIDLAKLNTISQLIYKIVSAFLIVVFMFFSIKMFKAQPAQLILIIMIFSRLWPRFSGIQANLEQLGSIAPSFKALIDLQGQCYVLKEFNEEDILKVKPLSIIHGIHLGNVYFRYNKNEPSYALKNINLTIPANKMTAIVGQSGAGKSTLIDLIMGLNTPESGEVLLDGMNLAGQNLLSLRKSISYVPQDPFLFNATIRDNLLIIDQDASEQQLWEALEFAAADDFVRKLPNGLDSLIGDRGIKLSGGERQRLVLARAILRRPSILILDEATSALDTENESKIQEAIEKLRGAMTVIVIAHRLSTIRNADQVIVLEQGEIIQQGKFKQLASETRGLFSKLLKKQMGVSV